MYIVLIVKGYFYEVTHKFVIKGHTYMSADRDFGLIEKKTQNDDLLCGECSTNDRHKWTKKNPFDMMIKEGFIDFKSVDLTAFERPKK